MVIELTHSNIYITEDRLLLSPKEEILNDISIDDKYKYFIEANLYVDNDLDILDIATVFECIPNIRIEHYQVLDNNSVIIKESEKNNIEMKLTFGYNLDIEIYIDNVLEFKHTDRFEKYNNDAIFVADYTNGSDINPNMTDGELIIGTF